MSADGYSIFAEVGARTPGGERPLWLQNQATLPEALAALQSPDPHAHLRLKARTLLVVRDRDAEGRVAACAEVSSRTSGDPAAPWACPITETTLPLPTVLRAGSRNAAVYLRSTMARGRSQWWTHCAYGDSMFDIACQVGIPVRHLMRAAVACLEPLVVKMRAHIPEADGIAHEAQAWLRGEPGAGDRMLKLCDVVEERAPTEMDMDDLPKRGIEEAMWALVSVSVLLRNQPTVLGAAMAAFGVHVARALGSVPNNGPVFDEQLVAVAVRVREHIRTSEVLYGIRTMSRQRQP